MKRSRYIATMNKTKEAEKQGIKMLHSKQVRRQGSK